MLLAGGQGSRLGVLTDNIAKPAVHFGGKYRIIDFTLSNCVNSGIDTVGVLTQYKPMELNEYIGSGKPWGLDRVGGGVHILQPYTKTSSREWYKGTANAIYQNLSFIERYSPEDVFILSGDHVYMMDYSVMLKRHKRTGADCTIATLSVKRDEAPRFGILCTDENDVINDFEEKPKNPKSSNASMGVYAFKWEILKKYLSEDEKDAASAHDFGKNIIPKMLKDGRLLMAYPFGGYWKDVGTIKSLWESNMDMLDDRKPLDPGKGKLKVYSGSCDLPPTFVSDGAVIKNSAVTKGCEIMGYVENSVISEGCVIENGAKVINSVIFPNVTVEEDAYVSFSVVGAGSVVGRGAYVGAGEEKEITVLASKSKTDKGEFIGCGEIYKK